MKCTEKQKQYMRDRQKTKRKEIIELYGGKCACCGESRWEFMSIDHINGDGIAHRKATGQGYGYYLSILKEGYQPDKYRVLCHNCNMALGAYGYCPHTNPEAA